MMPLQLWETTLDPTQRMLKQLTLEDAAEASMMFSLLMGDKVLKFLFSLYQWIIYEVKSSRFEFVVKSTVWVDLDIVSGCGE